MVKKLAGLLVLVALVAAAPAAYGWGYATHALVADELGHQGGARNLDEIYGACAPDMFEFRPLPVYGPGGLEELTHDHAAALWAVARTGPEKALALGFASHSDVFGADHTAHHEGVTYGEEDGYVIAKAAALQALLAANGWDLTTLLGDLPEGLEEDVYHLVVEYACDVLAVRIDPYVGVRIAAAATLRSDRFPDLFYAAYEDELEEILDGYAEDGVEALVQEVEAGFREGLASYGALLTLPEDDIVEAMAGLMADIAEVYLAQAGYDLPDGFDVAPLIVSYIEAALDLCEDDFQDELDATVDAVAEELEERDMR